MKKIIFVNLLLMASLSFAQTKIVTTEEGKKLVINEDNTWEYADVNQNSENICVVKDDFQESKWNSSKIRTRNKTTVNDLKRLVSKDTGVEISKIILLSYTDELALGSYLLCVDGEKMKYKRVGMVFGKDN